MIKLLWGRIAIYTQKNKCALLLTFIYALSVIYVSSFHEVWRDEVRALSLAKDSNSIIDLFHNLHNEGHPGLWHLILYFGYKLTHTTLILKVASILVAISAIYIFLSRSPFSWIQKTLYIFGYFPFYEYSVFNRNYGISMLLLFSFCSLYVERFKRFFLLSIILALLANTNAHSTIIASAIAVSIWIELIYFRDKSIKGNGERKKLISGFIVLIIGISCAIIQAYPDDTTLVTRIYFLHFSDAIKAGVMALISPGSIFCAAFGLTNSLTTCMIWLFYVYLLLRRPILFSIFFISVIGLGMFFIMVFYPAMRHQGLFYILIVSVFWLDRTLEIKTVTGPLNRITKFLFKAINLIFYLLLIMQVCKAYPAIKEELTTEYSSSKSFAMFLKRHEELKDAILISEPNYEMESMAYYVENPIYIPREERFGRTVKLTTASRSIFSLEELLNTAQGLKKEFKKPVVITIAYDLNFKGPFVIRVSNSKIFTYSAAQLFNFFKDTTKIASFHNAVGDENYDVFLLN